MKRKISKAHISFYHAYFLRADLREIPEDHSDIEVRLINHPETLLSLTGLLRSKLVDIASRGTLVLGAFRQDQFLGFICVSFNHVHLPELRKHMTFDGAYLWFGHILEPYRNQGIGTSLINKTLHLIRDKYDIAQAYGLIEADNIPSLRITALNGFHPYESVLFIELGRLTYYTEKMLKDQYDDHIHLPIMTSNPTY